jgi:hypothetical protein
MRAAPRRRSAVGWSRAVDRSGHGRTHLSMGFDFPEAIARKTGLDVNFQEVGHSVWTVNADVGKTQ